MKVSQYLKASQLSINSPALSSYFEDRSGKLFEREGDSSSVEVKYDVHESGSEYVFVPQSEEISHSPWAQPSREQLSAGLQKQREYKTEPPHYLSSHRLFLDVACCRKDLERIEQVSSFKIVCEPSHANRFRDPEINFEYGTVVIELLATFAQELIFTAATYTNVILLVIFRSRENSLKISSPYLIFSPFSRNSFHHLAQDMWRMR